jgi:hypothetical protein
MKSSRPRKDELVEGRQRAESMFGKEVEPPGLDHYWKAVIESLPPEDRPSPEKLAREESKERWNQVVYKSDLDEVINYARSGLFKRLADFLPLYSVTLLRDVLSDTYSFKELYYLFLAARKGNNEARAEIQNIADGLTWWGSGRPEIPEEERKAIVADCEKWWPICEDLNEAFKRLWKQSEYESSELYQKEARGLLAEKYGISVKEVKTIERVLKTPSRTSSKSTPTEAMLQMVALDHVDRDIKTIEGIWLAHLKDYPEKSRKRRKRSTIRPAGRIA